MLSAWEALSTAIAVPWMCRAASQQRNRVRAESSSALPWQAAAMVLLAVSRLTAIDDTMMVCASARGKPLMSNCLYVTMIL